MKGYSGLATVSEAARASGIGLKGDTTKPLSKQQVNNYLQQLSMSANNEKASPAAVAKEIDRYFSDKGYDVEALKNGKLVSRGSNIRIRKTKTGHWLAE